MARYSYFAHKQGILLAGGQTFFGPSREGSGLSVFPALSGLSGLSELSAVWSSSSASVAGMQFQSMRADVIALLSVFMSCALASRMRRSAVISVSGLLTDMTA